MKVLAKALLRLDGLSHVLAWTRDPVLACKDPASLDFVELPRLRLRFEAKADGPGGKVGRSCCQTTLGSVLPDYVGLRKISYPLERIPYPYCSAAKRRIC